MEQFLIFIKNIEWSILILFCLTLGLAPYAPPHLFEKINMLIKGTLKRPIDWIDLVFHSIPWILLFIKVIVTMKNGSVKS
jgi:hypothetical protein